MADLKKRHRTYYIRFREMIGGERQEITRSLSTKNKDTAYERKKMLEQRAQKTSPFSSSFNWDVRPERQWYLVRECYDDFIASKSKFRNSTLRGYKYVLSQFFDAYNLWGLKIDAIQRHHAERFLTREGIKPVTMHSQKIRLKAFWNWCIDEGRVQENIIDDIILPQKNVQYRPKMISNEQFEKLLEAFRSYHKKSSQKPWYREWMQQHWFEPAMAVFFFSGCRRSEIAFDTDIEHSGLRGEHILGVPGKKIDFIYKSKAKRNRERFIPVNSILEKYLLNYFRVRGWPGDDEFVFINGHGNPVTGSTMLEQFKKFCKKAKLPDSLTIHGMRHRRATNWLEQGFTLQEVKDMLGHYSVQVTDQIYSHLTPNKLKEKMDRLEKER